MNGLLIASLVIVLLLVVYLILQTIGCLWSRHNRIKRGTEGLPGLDSDQSPRTFWTILGNILYWFYGLPCRLCCPWQVHIRILYPLYYRWFLPYNDNYALLVRYWSIIIFQFNKNNHKSFNLIWLYRMLCCCFTGQKSQCCFTH